MKNFLLVILMSIIFPFLGFSDSFLNLEEDERLESTGDSNTYRLTNLLTPFAVLGTASNDITDIYVKWGPDYIEDKDIVKSGYKLTKFVKNSGKFFFRVFPGLGNLEEGSTYYTIVGFSKGKAVARYQLIIYYSVYFGERAKPIIYLYPQKETAVEISVHPKEGLKITIPEMGSKWKVIAQPDSSLVNSFDGKTYPYLFWESPDSSKVFDPKEGFCIAQKDLKNFFTEKLTIQGLNAKEISDFLDYWLKELSKKPYYLISFVDQAVLDRDAPIVCNPKPDTIIRIYFDHKGLEAAVKIAPQKLVERKRFGFTLTEWGGRRYP